ncbi:transcriptional regulator, AsnC family [Shimia gijangensis]|uniref:Siroheme decarboxylase NirG subunit n=1 Tax=Shimia gijangensis TaxID=1470563 RepID=A0A1M6LTW7_9RHOB|nr:AsnC family transcriptional regulator [Shimia gijangensis]SHJ74643.1 transcriptional regulator, AsnC family [Shimia gijangensis]
MSDLSQIDRDLINTLQDDLSLDSRPFATVADKLGISEDDVLERTKWLKENGYLTRFGPFFDAAAMGGAFCLCAMAVPEDKFEDVLTKVNAHAEVAHNYERAHRLNMWFVLATETPDGITATADAIERETGITVHCFPKLQEFYIGFRVAA